MAAPSVEPGSGLAAQIQSAVQPKLMENGWVVEENDTTLSEYVTMMVVNGKDLQGVMSELGGDLLGVGEDDPAVGEFARWLFEQARSLAQPQEQSQPQQEAPQTQDTNMDDSAAASGDAPYVNNSHYFIGGRDAQHAHGNRLNQAQMYFQAQRFYYLQQQQQLYYNQQLTYGSHRPTGPKSMRNGNAGPRGGRGGRMLGQMNRNMDRSELPENLRKIRGAAGIQAGRIDSHSNRAPRGPRGNANMANGIQRAMNGGRGAHHNNMNGGGMMANNQMNPQQQMQLMQMMEMQANILTQMMSTNGGQMGGMNNGGGRGGFQARGGRGGRGNNAQSRGGHAPPAPKVLHAENGKMPLGALSSSKPIPANNATADSMDLDDSGANRPQPKFSTMCRFNQACTNPSCDFAHQNPTSTTPVSVDMNETCTFGVACKNFKCTARHPSPAGSAQGGAGGAAQLDCKFWPHCTNASCPFRHGNGAAPCRNGPDCAVEGCTFAHSKIACRFHPCTNSRCTFKHEPGQKAGGASGGKTWSKGRFETEEGKEELILPGQQLPGQQKLEEVGIQQVKEEKMDEAHAQDVAI